LVKKKIEKDKILLRKNLEQQINEEKRKAIFINKYQLKTEANKKQEQENKHKKVESLLLGKGVSTKSSS